MKTDFDGPRSVHYEATDPGLDWIKDPWVSIDVGGPLGSTMAMTPNVIRMPGGGYRMYYTGRSPVRSAAQTDWRILSAHSEDAVTWVKEPGVRVDAHPPYASQDTLCPDVIPLPDGRYRMYYEARSLDDRPSVVLSAVSQDGLDWELEPGVRFGDDTWSYGSPRCLYMEPPGEGREGLMYRIYFHHYSFPLVSGLRAQNNIISAISEDGLHFEKESGVRIAQETDRETYAVYAPEVVLLGDGTYRMYYPPWAINVRGGIFAASSRDGLAWVKHPAPLIDLGGPWDNDMVSEPCVIGLDDGRFRMFYEAKDDEGSYRILSATSAPSTADQT